MSSLANRNLNEDVTYWGLGAGRSDFNAITYLTPILLKGRWNESAELIRNKAGEEVVSKTICYLDQDIEADGYLALGDFTSEEDPRAVPGAAEIIQYQTSTDLRNVGRLRKAFM